MTWGIIVITLAWWPRVLDICALIYFSDNSIIVTKLSYLFDTLWTKRQLIFEYSPETGSLHVLFK